jgi:hypothetical protein
MFYQARGEVSAGSVKLNRDEILSGRISYPRRIKYSDRTGVQAQFGNTRRR